MMAKIGSEIHGFDFGSLYIPPESLRRIKDVRKKGLQFSLLYRKESLAFYLLELVVTIGMD
jgi:hypothetical protein